MQASNLTSNRNTRIAPDFRTLRCSPRTQRFGYYSQDEVQTILVNLVDAINQYVNTLPIVFKGTVTVSDSGLGRSVSYRVTLGKTSYTIDVRVSYQRAEENIRDLKRKESSFRIRATTISTHIKNGVHILLGSSDLHIFSTKPSVDLSINACEGYDALTSFISRYFSKVN